MSSATESFDERPLKWVPGSYRELIAVALPMVLSASTQSMMHVVDRIYLTWYSKDTVAAALPAGILFWSCLSLPFGIISYLNAFVAQYDGARRPDRVSASVWQGIYFATFCGLLLFLPALWSDSFFNWVGHSETVWPLEATYFRYLCTGGLAALLPAALSCFFSGRGQTTVVLAVNASSVFVNAGLDWAMIFGRGPFPEMGIAGAATATNLANLYATLCYAALMYYYSVHGPYQFSRHRRFDWTLMKDLFRFGGPSGLQMFLDVAGFTAFIMIIGLIGPHELAATNIAFNLNTLAFTPVIGVGIAVSTLVGQRIGEGRPELAKATTWKGFVFGGGIMLLCGFIYVVFPQVLLVPYALYADGDDFSATKDVVIVLLRFVALYSFFDAMAIIFGSAIRAAGDTVFSMIVTCVCAWGLLVIPTYLTWEFYGKSLILSWVWCSVYVITLGFVFLARFVNGRWMTMSIMDHAPVEHSEPVATVEPRRQLDHI
ncbi:MULTISPECIES: MATE family efflux transporter [unclassified Schlesneria]|uniref:MATE family efflux transporter n=1 Tax=Schlesneria TaxID=656899 RepID=UPI002F03633F